MTPRAPYGGAVRLADYSLAQAAHALFRVLSLWLPGRPAAFELNVALLGSVGELGLVHRDIIGPGPAWPLSTKRQPARRATYPALWNHDAKNETRLVCLPDSELLVRQGMEEKAAMIADNCQPCPCDSRLPIQLAASCCCFHRSGEHWWYGMA